MSYIKFEHRHLGEDRWLDVSPSAFVVHAWALDYCNEQATDGAISSKMALRLTCPVMPTDIAEAWEELVDAGIWEATEAGYFCPEFNAHGIAASEQEATRQKWAEDKRRQRLHSIGNHQLCKPSRCTAAHVSTSGQVESSTPGQVDDPTRPDSTRPDQTPEGGSGKGLGVENSTGDQPAPGSAVPSDAIEARREDDVFRPRLYDEMTPEEIKAGREAGAKVTAEIRAWKAKKKAEEQQQRENANREREEQRRAKQAELDRQLAEIQAREGETA